MSIFMLIQPSQPEITIKENEIIVIEFEGKSQLNLNANYSMSGL
jgi:hypothetical protein